MSERKPLTKSGDHSTNQLSRRSVLGGTIAVAASSLVLKRPAHAAETLNVLCWPGYEERVVVSGFEQEFNAKVNFKTYIGGEQMLQLLQQSPRGTYDAIIADAEFVRKLKALNFIEPFSSSQVDELQSYHPLFRDFEPTRAESGMTYGIPTRFSFYGISYNSKFVTAEEAGDWNSLLDAKFSKKVAIFNNYLAPMGNASLAVFPRRPNPYDLTDAELQQVREWLLKLRPQIAVFGSSQVVAQAMTNSGIVIAPTGDLDIELKLAGYPQFESKIPVQGSIRWHEVATLCADSKSKALAKKWIGYMSRAKVQSDLVYTKAFKARAPNLNVVNYWTNEQKSLLGYVPDPAQPQRLLVETMIEKTIPRGLPVNQPESRWIEIYNEFMARG